MLCPRDGTQLQTKSFRDASVDACPQCRGMYLAHGQLNRAADPTPGDLEFSSVDGDSFDHGDDHPSINCPHDGAVMVKVDFNVDTKIILDYCRTCLGFWLDDTELQRINDEVRRLNQAGEEVKDSLLVRISQFFWNFPLPH